MKRIFLIAVAGLATTVQAAPLEFFDTLFETTAVASAEGVADLQVASSPPAATPLITSAAAIGSTDSAFAEAFATPGFLSTSAEVNAISDVAVATGSARFVGSFGNGGALSLSFDFNSIGFPLPSPLVLLATGLAAAGLAMKHRSPGSSAH